MENDEIKLKVVISPAVASKLCDLGYPIVKIKPKRIQDGDNFNCTTVFLFRETDAFLRDFKKLTDTKRNL